MLRLPMLALLSTALIACSDTGRIDVSVAAQPLAAEPADGAKLNVTVTAVRVHVGDDDDQEVVETDGGAAEDGDAGGAGWTTVFEGAQALDLVDGQATALFLGTAEVPAGRITQIRVVLADDPSYVAGGETHAVTCPSCSTSGLKIVTRGSLVLDADQHLALELSFAPETTLELTPTGYRMAPVVKLDKVTEVADDD